MRKSPTSKSIGKLPPIIIGIIIVTSLAAGLFLLQQPAEQPRTSSTAQLRVGQDGEAIAVEIARTPEAHTKGLSGRAELPPNTGMLFVYEEPARYSFWMKDMNFALDFVWIGADQKIVAITRDVKPASFPESFQPPSPVIMMLEVEAGTAAERGWEVGSSVKLKPI